MYFPGKRSRTSLSTFYRKATVFSFPTQSTSCITPQLSATLKGPPVQLSSGYAASAAIVCPGISISGTIAVEGVMFAVGLGMYLRTTRARDRVGSVGLWSLVTTLVLIYVVSAFGAPPPSSSAVAWTAQGLWLFVLWAFWVDRHRD